MAQGGKQVQAWSMDPAQIPAFDGGPKKRKRPCLEVKQNARPRVLFFTKGAAVDKTASIIIHGAITLSAVCCLSDSRQHCAIEDQRKIYGANVAAFEFEDVQLLPSPTQFFGKDVCHAGNTGTLKKTPEVLKLCKSMGIEGWPSCIRIDDAQLWALSNSRIPALVLPQNTRERLGLFCYICACYI